MQKIDKRALQILKNSYSYNLMTGMLKGVSKEDFEYAKAQNIMFDELQINHEQAIKWLSEEVSKIEKDKVTNLFLASLSTRYLDWRAGLGSYALSYLMPLHDFESDKRYSSKICKICGHDEYNNPHDLNLINFSRLFGHSVLSDDIVHISFYLQEFSKIENIEPQKADFEIFKEILKLIQDFEPTGTIGKLEKEIGKIKHFKSNNYERVSFLEALGYCGILQTNIYKGFYPNFIYWSHRNEGHIKNDWQYPVQFWRGKDSINVEALRFWFGNYMKHDYL